MPRKRLPSHCHHRGSGQGVVRLNGHDYYTGPWGSAEADAEYDRLIAEYLAKRAKGDTSTVPIGEAPLVREIIARYDAWIEIKLTRNGVASAELFKARQALGLLRNLYGPTAATSFDALGLEAIRLEMVRLGWTRSYVNRCAGFIKACFRWAAKNKLAPATVWAEVATVENLRRGEFGVKEDRRIKPVSPGVFARTIKHVMPTVRDFLIIQWLTGMRPCEVALMRPADIDQAGRDPSGARHPGVWVYVPTRHKTEHHDVDRVVFLGPRAQRILKRYLSRAADQFLFSPRESRASWYQARRSLRKSKVQPSQVCRCKKLPQKAPGDRYRTTSIDRAIRQGARLADVLHWAPHQLRHLRATQVRSRFTPDAARIVLGHKLPGVTGRYAESDLAIAADVMRRIG